MATADQPTTATAITRGLRRRCPHCGAPTLFAGFLKVRPICPNCREDNGQYRVDDIASYATVLIVGHLVVAPALAIPAFWTMPLGASLAILLGLVGGITVAALPYVKGGVIGALAATSGRPKA